MIKAYKVGFCPQCGKNIMVADCKGYMTSMKVNFRQAELKFSDGHRVRLHICSDCLASPDADTLMEAITHPGSRAARQEELVRIKEKGKPISISEVSPRRHWKRDWKELNG